MFGDYKFLWILTILNELEVLDGDIYTATLGGGPVHRLLYL